MKLVRVLLADDHTLLAQALRRLLEPHVELLGTASNGRELVAAAERLRPDLVLLDISMPVLNGIEAARELKRLLPNTKMIFLTMHSDAAYVREALRAGAAGYLLKWSAEEELLRAIDEAMSGRIYLTPLLPAEVLEGAARRAGRGGRTEAELTLRERQVLELAAEGKSAKEIARILHVSAKTAEFHKYRIMKKLGLATTAELMKYAIARGMIQ